MYSPPLSLFAVHSSKWFFRDWLVLDRLDCGFQEQQLSGGLPPPDARRKQLAIVQFGPAESHAIKPSSPPSSAVQHIPRHFFETAQFRVQLLVAGRPRTRIRIAGPRAVARHRQPRQADGRTSAQFGRRPAGRRRSCRRCGSPRRTSRSQFGFRYETPSPQREMLDRLISQWGLFRPVRVFTFIRWRPGTSTHPHAYAAECRQKCQWP